MFTERRESDKSSITLNSVPLVPSALNKVSFDIEDVTCKTPEGSVVFIPNLPLI